MCLAEEGRQRGDGPVRRRPDGTGLVEHEAGPGGQPYERVVPGLQGRVAHGRRVGAVARDPGRAPLTCGEYELLLALVVERGQRGQIGRESALAGAAEPRTGGGASAREGVGVGSATATA